MLFSSEWSGRKANHKERLMSKSRRWTITVNNPVYDGEVQLQALGGIYRNVVMAVWQLERGEEKNTPHWQAYCEWRNPVRLKTVQDCWGTGCHAEASKGNRRSNVAYASKEETRAEITYYYPDRATVETMCLEKPGKRNDIAELRDAILEGKDYMNCWMSHAIQMAKFPRMYSNLINIRRPIAQEDRELILCYGDPGTGKTRWVMEQCDHESMWCTPIGGGQWFDGYDKQPDVVFDDMAGAASGRRLDDCLRLFDPYGVQRVPVKGGYRWWNPKRIFITTNIHPRGWWKWKSRQIQYKALQRRFSRILHFTEGPVAEDLDITEFFDDWEKYWQAPLCPD